MGLAACGGGRHQVGGAVPAARQPFGDQLGERRHHGLGPGPVGDVLAGERRLVHRGAQVAERLLDLLRAAPPRLLVEGLVAGEGERDAEQALDDALVDLAREVDALLKGGVQRLYLGNLKVGNHELVAVFSGKGPDNRDYRRGASLKFDKSIGAKYLELKIEDRQRKMQPEFEIKDWE